MDCRGKICYKYNKFLLSLIGFWPYQNNISKIVNRFIISVIGLSATFALVAIFFTVKINFNAIIIHLPYATCAILETASLWLFYWKSRDHNYLWEEVINTWKYEINNDEIKIMHRFTSEGEYYTLAMAGALFGIIISFIPINHMSQILNIISPKNETRINYMMYYVEYFVDKDKYENPILLHCDLIKLGAITALSANATAFIVFIKHTCALFAILGYRIQRIFELTNETRVNHLLLDCIKIHKNCLKFASRINDYYAVQIGCHLPGSILIISFHIARVIDNDYFNIRHINFLVLQIAYFIVICYIGQLIINASSQFSIDIYNSKWYNQSESNKRLMLIMLFRSQMYCKLSFFEFVLSLETSLMLLKTMMSYCAVARKMR